MKILRGDIGAPTAASEPPALLPPANREISVTPPKARPAHRQAQDRRSMLDRAILLVERARRNGTVLDIDAETENLLHGNPACRMSFAELRADFATVAARSAISPVPVGER